VAHGSLFSAVPFEETLVSHLAAFLMPINFDRSNRMIDKGIINKWSLNEDNGSDTSCYREIEISQDRL
jgi:hypothetical protein